MDAGLLRWDVCDFLEDVDPFWNAVHQLGMVFEVVRVFDGLAIEKESILGYTFANTGMRDGRR
jgi:hypothetical protein